MSMRLAMKDEAGEGSVPRAFMNNTTGQDALRLRRRVSANTLEILGAIKYGTNSQTSGIVVCLCRGDPMKVSNIYRRLRGLETAGLIVKDGLEYSLTESGEQVCPDKKRFDALMDASNTIFTVKKEIRGC